MPIECLECNNKKQELLELSLINGKLEFMCKDCIAKKKVIKKKDSCDICRRLVMRNNLVTTKVRNYYLCDKCFLEVYNDGIRAGKC